MNHAEQISAAKKVDQSLDKNRIAEDASGIRANLQSLGRIAFDEKKDKLAIEYFVECIEYCKVLGDDKGRAMSLTKLMQIARRAGNHSLAKEYEKQKNDAYQW